jgi:CRP/FNR family transcriptional regulator, cyclic AMP receptor protein
MAVKLVEDKPEKFIRKICVGGSERKYRDREPIFSQGDPGRAVYFIQSGMVKLTVISKSRKKAVIALLQPGEFFGQTCLGPQPMRAYAATSVGPSVVTRVQKKAFIEVLRNDTPLALWFIEFLLCRTVQVEDDLLDHFFNFSERRLARVLLRFGPTGDDAKGEDYTINLSQQTLAEMIGTTRPRVSHFMNEFKKRGLISYNGALQVHRKQMMALLQG